MKTWVIDSEKDHMEAIVELKAINPSLYKRGQCRIELHISGEGPELDHNYPETQDLGEHPSGMESDDER